VCLVRVLLVNPPGDDARARIQRLLVTGDNRLKQGVAPEKARESYEQALEAAREAGLEEAVRPLVELRLADLAKIEQQLARESAPPAPPDA
jgi:RNA-splicing ligase RtcB